MRREGKRRLARRGEPALPVHCDSGVITGNQARAMNLDWHADRSVLPDLVLLDQLELGEPIDVATVRGYRLGRVRDQMEAHQLHACVLLDTVNIR